MRQRYFGSGSVTRKARSHFGPGLERLEDRRLLSVAVADAFGYDAHSLPNQGQLLVDGPGVTVALAGDQGMPLDDDVTAIDLGSNTFNFYGKTYGTNLPRAQVFVSSNGLLTFGVSGNDQPNNDDFGIATAITQAAIAPLWDNWFATNAAERVVYSVSGDRLIVQWENLHDLDVSPSTVTFQAVLDLNTGSQPGAITFNYFDLVTGNAASNNAASSTVGIKNANTIASHLLVSFNTSANDWVREGKSIRIALNQAPVLDAVGPFTVGESGMVTLTATATDPDGDPLTYAWDLDGDGTYETTGQTVVFSAAGLSNPDVKTVHVQVSDDHKHSVSASADVTVVNVAPTAVADSFNGLEDGSVSDNVLANDTDPGNDALTAVLDAAPSNGTVALNQDGSFTYTPAANFFGADTFTYHAADVDVDSLSSGSVTVTINVAEQNDAPLAADDAASTDEDTPVSGNVLANDVDPDNTDGIPGNEDTLTAALVDAPLHGAIVLHADGTYTYTPGANYFGDDAFTYRVSDGRGGSSMAAVSLHVTEVNDAPVAADDAAATKEDAAVTGNVLANDTDVDVTDTLSAALVAGPAHGTVALASDGGYTYTPAANYFGGDSFTYKALDGRGGESLATVTLTVTEVNDAPVASPDAATTAEDTAVSGNVLSNDTDADVTDGLAGNDDTLTAALVNGPAHGTVSLASDGSFTYTPAANYFGSDAFTYKVLDGRGGASVATVSLAIAEVNDAPVAGADAATISEDTVATGNVLTNDVDPDNADGVTGNEDAVTATLVAGPTRGTVALAADGSFSYTPFANFFGTDRFTYQAVDGDGAASDVTTVTITVNEVNDAPVAVDDSANATHDAPLVGNVLVNDTDPDNDDGYVGNEDVLTAELVSGVQHGTLTLESDGRFTYTPDANFAGTDAFQYRVNDGRGGSSVGTATITVASQPEPQGGVQLVDDATMPGKTALVVNGTNAGEVIALLPKASGVEVYIGVQSRGVYYPTGRLIVHANGGNDLVYVAPGVNNPAWLYGDDGNDVLKLGHGGGIAFGGAGNDAISGGNGRDVLVGGEGADLLIGNPGDDILISAVTVYDDRFAVSNHEDAWAHVTAEWNSARSFTDRVKNLSVVGGGTADRANGSYFLNDATVDDDVSRDSIDLLSGSAGQDWYIYKFGEDLISGMSSSEAAVDLTIT